MICDACNFFYDGKQDCKNCWVFKQVEREQREEVEPNPEWCGSCELEFDSAARWGNERCIVDMKVQ